jgi:hypothetical protein
MTKTNTEHVVVSMERGAFECLHCGTLHRIVSPLLAEVYLSQGRGFLWMHKLCKPVPPPERQLSFPVTPLQKVSEVQQPREGRATTWAEMWPQLEQALELYEYEALVQHTEFPLNLQGHAWDRVADWLQREVGNDPGLLLPRPEELEMCIEAALVAAKLRAPVEPATEKPKKKRRRLALAR